MPSRYTITVLLLLAVLVSILPAAAQGGPAWQVTAAQPLALPSTVAVRIFPAPDGRHLGFENAVRLNSHYERYVCALDSTTGEEALCLQSPEDHSRGFDIDPRTYFMPFGWSADSARLAVVGEPFLSGLDTDLWVLEPASGTWTNLTDDGYAGPLAAAEGSTGAPEGVTVFTQPAWSPDGTQIAAEQTVMGAGGRYTPSTVSVVDVSTGDVTVLTTLPGSASDEQDAGAVTSIAWAPDGLSLAFSLRHNNLKPESDGVWQIDAAGGEPVRLAGISQIEAALHEVFADVALDSIGPLAWSPDGANILLWAGNLNSTPIAIWAFVLNIAEGTLTPIALPAHPNDTGVRRGIWPFQAAWAPDGGALLVATNGSHPDETVTALDPAARPRITVRLVDLAAGTSTLLGGLPAGASVPLYLASWGPDGDALLNGYHLMLESGSSS